MYIYLSLYLNMCSLVLHLYVVLERTYIHVLHDFYMQEYVYYAQAL